MLFVGSFKQRTIPWQMFSGIREHISPTILAVATILVIVSVALLVAVELSADAANDCAAFRKPDRRVGALPEREVAAMSSIL